MNQSDVNILLEIYSHSFRPKIFEILKFMKELKDKNIIHNLVLYTKNNNESFVNMVLLFIEEYIVAKNTIDKHTDKINLTIFDHIVFSKSKYKHLEPLLKLKDMYDEIETQICFIDNKNYNYKTESTNVTIYFIECDTYKHYYSHEEIAKKMNYEIYDKLNKKTVYKYFKTIYKNKQIIRNNIPSKIHEFNSLYIFNLLNNFCFLAK